MTQPPPRGARIRHVDLLHSAYNLLLAAIWGACLGKTSAAIPLSLLHLTVAALPLLLRRARAQWPATASVLREYYPLLLAGCYWIELAPLIPLLHSGTHDLALQQLESSLTRGMWNSMVANNAGHSILNETMYFFYASYLPLLVLPPFILGLRGRIDVLRDLSARVCLVAMTCFICDLAWPVAGPSYVAMRKPIASGIFSSGMIMLRTLGDAKGTAFPSLHVTVSVTIVLVAWRWFSRRLALLLSALVFFLSVSCVYTGNHYVPDVLAGALLALVLWALPMRASTLPANDA